MNVRFFAGTKAQYLSLPAPRNPLGLYFCEDTKELFWADRLLTDGIRVVQTYADLPKLPCAADGTVYYVTETRNGYTLSPDRTEWLQTIYAPATDAYEVPESEIYNTVTTVGAVRDIEAKIYKTIDERIANIEVGISGNGVKAIYFAGVKLDELDGTFTIDRLCALQALGFNIPEGLEDEEIELVTKDYVDEQIAAIESQDLSNYYTKSQVDSLIPSVSDFVTNSKLQEELAKIEHPTVDLSGYYNKLETDKKIAEAVDSIKPADLSNYYNKTEVDALIPEVGNFATKEELTEAINGITHPTTDLTNYVTRDELDGFITKIPEEYVTESELSAKGYITDVSDKADINHKHDDLYDAKGAAEAVKNDLLNGAGDAYDTLKELGDLINENVSALDALELIAAGKADKEHEHAQYLTELPVHTHDEYLTTLPEHSHDEYLRELPEHTHDQYLTTHQDLSGYAKKTELFSKSYNDLTDLPEIPSIEGLATEKFVKDSIDAITIPEIPENVSAFTNDAGYVTAADIPDTTGFITMGDVEGKGYLTSEDIANKVDKSELTSFATKEEVEAVEGKIPSLADYATKQDVSDVVAGIEIPEVNLENYHTKSEVSELLNVKADDVPFTTDKFVTISVGKFAIAENIAGRTVAELFAKLLGLSDEKPGENPDTPDIPDEPELPDTPEGLIDYLTNKNKSIAYVYDDNDNLTPASFTDPVVWTSTEAKTDKDFINTAYKIKDDNSGDITEVGYQLTTTYSNNYWATVALPSEITNITTKIYEPDIPDWIVPNWTMVPAEEQTIEGYTIWVVPEEYEIDGGATYRFIIN